MRVTFVWEDMTKISGVGTWIEQAVRLLPGFGVDASILDIAQLRLGHDARTQIRDRVVELSRPSRCSEHGWRKRIRKAVDGLKTDVIVFHDHRHAEDVLDALPDGFPAMNVLHLDRPDEGYDARIRSLADRVRGFPCVSPTVLNRAEKIVEGKARFLPLGIDIPAPPPLRTRGRPIRAIYVGRVVQEQKRILDLVPFAEALDGSATVDVYGDGSAMPELRERALPGVTLHGAVPHEDVLEAMKHADVLLLFSEYEGLPLVLLEACARGVVPLVTEIRSGIGDLLTHGENALLFPVGEPAQAAAILNEQQQWDHLQEGARAVGERYTLSTCMATYARWMQDLSVLPHPLSKQMSLRPRGRAWVRDHLPVK